MSGVYTIPIPEASITQAMDIVEINGHAARPYIVIGVRLGQKTENANAQEEQLHLQLRSGMTTSGAGGSAATPNSRDKGNTTPAGLTAEILNTTLASGGTIHVDDTFQWNVRGPMPELIPEEYRVLMPAGRRTCITLVTAPADATTIFGEVIVQEIG